MIPLSYSRAELEWAKSRIAIIAAQVRNGQRIDHTETTHLTDEESGLWGLMAELAVARRYLGISFRYELTGSRPVADLSKEPYRYEVRGTPWIYRRVWESGKWRTFVYERETRDPQLIIARVDTFGIRPGPGEMFLTGWMWARDAAAYPLDPGRKIKPRHAMWGLAPLQPAETMPGLAAGDSSEAGPLCEVCDAPLNPWLARHGDTRHLVCG